MTETIGAKVNRNIDNLADAVQNAQNLDELCAYVNKMSEIVEGFKTAQEISDKDEDRFVELYGVDFEKAEDYVRFFEGNAITELPVFTDEEDLTQEFGVVWSWDNERILVPNPNEAEGGFVIEDRPEPEPDETPTP